MHFEKEGNSRRSGPHSIPVGGGNAPIGWLAINNETPHKKKKKSVEEENERLDRCSSDWPS